MAVKFGRDDLSQCGIWWQLSLAAMVSASVEFGGS